MAITVPVFQVDAFTDRQFAGNPAGVVLDADGLTAGQMQLIARELNNGDTAFALQPDGPDHDVRVRFFTPRSEAAFVGHATVALHAVLATLRRAAAPRQKQKSGLVSVRADVRDGACSVSIAQPPPVLRGAPEPALLQAVLAALGIGAEELDAAAPPMIAGEASGRLLLAVHSGATLARLQPDLPALAALSPRLGTPGYFVYTRHAADADTEARMFCPALGIPEDPVSGNAHGMLGAWLWQCGLLRASAEPAAGMARAAFTGAQGRHVQRPGQVRVELRIAAGAVAGVSIGGSAVVVFQTSVTV